MNKSDSYPFPYAPVTAKWNDQSVEYGVFWVCVDCGAHARWNGNVSPETLEDLTWDDIRMEVHHESPELQLLAPCPTDPELHHMVIKDSSVVYTTPASSIVGPRPRH